MTQPCEEFLRGEEEDTMSQAHAIRVLLRVHVVFVFTLLSFVVGGSVCPQYARDVERAFVIVALVYACVNGSILTWGVAHK